jgi:hypothetical protein
MTSRKRLFLDVQNQLKTVTELEVIDYHRNQFAEGVNQYPNQYTAALIKIDVTDYASMTEGIKEGSNAIVEIHLYIKDGWMDQHQNTSDPEGGLIEIDLIDKIEEALENLTGNDYRPLKVIQEDEIPNEGEPIMGFIIKFGTKIFKRINYGYTKTAIQITT